MKNKDFSIKTVKDLKEVLSQLKDTDPVYIYWNDTCYNVSLEIGSKECWEHNGKRWIAEGIFINIDG